MVEPYYELRECVRIRCYFVPGEYHYRGWITEFLEGTKYAKDIDLMISGLVSVPIDIIHPSGVEDTAAVVAGMLGFTGRSFQGWSLLLASDSPLIENIILDMVKHLFEHIYE